MILVYAYCIKNSDDFNKAVLMSNFVVCTPHIDFELVWTSNFNKALQIPQDKEIWVIENLGNSSLYFIF